MSENGSRQGKPDLRSNHQLWTRADSGQLHYCGRGRLLWNASGAGQRGSARGQDRNTLQQLANVLVLTARQDERLIAIERRVDRLEQAGPVTCNTLGNASPASREGQHLQAQHRSQRAARSPMPCSSTFWQR